MDSENNILKYSILEVEQPIGTFYLASIPANVLLRTVKSARRFWKKEFSEIQVKIE